MDATFGVTEILAFYKCKDCGHTISKKSNRGVYFPKEFVKKCPNKKCPSHSIEEVSFAEEQIQDEIELTDSISINGEPDATS